MTVPKKIASIKRFGPRYGRSVKYKVGAIEHEQRKTHKCPKCSKVGVKRLSKGIWQCKKCNAKFAGRAYSPETTKI